VLLFFVRVGVLVDMLVLFGLVDRDGRELAVEVVLGEVSHRCERQIGGIRHEHLRVIVDENERLVEALVDRCEVQRLDGVVTHVPVHDLQHVFIL